MRKAADGKARKRENVPTEAMINAIPNAKNKQFFFLLSTINTSNTHLPKFDDSVNLLTKLERVYMFLNYVLNTNHSFKTISP